MTSQTNDYTAYLDSPIGCIEINATPNGVYKINFVEQPSVPENEHAITQSAKEQLHAYFLKERTVFTFPIELQGTDFQRKVWKQLSTIPFGMTCSYLQMAQKLGDEKCIRAAAAANGKNPIAIVIPCHRVIGKDGTLTGYAGGLWRKKWLLEHEQSIPSQTMLF